MRSQAARQATLISQKPVFDFQAKLTRVGRNVRIDLATKGIVYVDAFSDGRPQQSRDTVDDIVELEFAAVHGAKSSHAGVDPQRVPEPQGSVAKHTG
jgi:hypothetical protein